MKTIWAIVKLQVEGTHKYPGAKGEIQFLSYKHRHIFYITVYIEQFHTDRDIEYIGFKKWLQEICPKGELGTQSCEQIADYLSLEIKNKYPNRKLKVIVLEDGENGAALEG